MKNIVIIPTYNERENLDGLLADLLTIPLNLHAMVVDDASPDGTGEIADAWASHDGRGAGIRLVERYISALPGMNSRLDELQAASLRVKLRYLDRENARRREVAQAYTHLLADSSLELPTCRPGAEHIYHQYVMRTLGRDFPHAYLREEDIGTLIRYPQPIHLQPAAYRGGLDDAGPLPNTEQAAAEVLSLLMYPELSDEHVTLVADTIRHWHKRHDA